MSETLLNDLVNDVEELIRENSKSINGEEFLSSFKSRIENRFKDAVGSKLRRQSSPRDSCVLSQPLPERTRPTKKRKLSGPEPGLKKRPRPRIASIIRAQKKKERDMKLENQRKERQRRQKERRETMEKKRKNSKQSNCSQEKWTSPQVPKKIRRRTSKEKLRNKSNCSSRRNSACSSRKNSTDSLRKTSSGSFRMSQEPEKRNRSNSSPREIEKCATTDPFREPQPRAQSKKQVETIEISDYESEDEESGLSSPRDWEHYPDWARPSNVIIQLNRQFLKNPEIAFGRITDVVCNIKQIFSTPTPATEFRLNQKRMTTGDWTNDTLGSAEIQEYDKEMGFETLSQT